LGAGIEGVSRKPKDMAEMRQASGTLEQARNLAILACLFQAAETLIRQHGRLIGALGGPFLLYLLGFEIWAINVHGIMLAASLTAAGLASLLLVAASLSLVMGQQAGGTGMVEALKALLFPCPLSRLVQVLFIAVLIAFTMLSILFIGLIFIVIVTNRYGLIFPEISLIGFLSGFLSLIVFFRLVLAFPATFDKPRGALTTAWRLSRGRIVRLAGGLVLALLPGLGLLLAVLLVFGELRQSSLPGFTVFYFDLDLPLPGGWVTLQALIIAASLVAVLNGALVMGFLAKAYERLRGIVPTIE
jgi:hypothetical protein